MSVNEGDVPPENPVQSTRPRASGDGWVQDAAGQRYWGLFGAAGLLLFHPDAGILLQHRATWSHFGGTWGIPGGARHENESAVSAATREAGEEAGVPAAIVDYRFSSVVDLGVWSYTTVVATARERFTPIISDPESLELRWVPVGEVDQLPLHPGFAASWPRLRDSLRSALTVVVDCANVVGSRPDGWWRDRIGAAERLADHIREWTVRGISGGVAGLTFDSVFPAVVLVLEGQARGAAIANTDRMTVVSAHTDGDSSIVDLVGAHQHAAEPGSSVLVVTADRALASRVESLGAHVVSPRWLLSEIAQD